MAVVSVRGWVGEEDGWEAEVVLFVSICICVIFCVFVSSFVEMDGGVQLWQ